MNTSGPICLFDSGIGGLTVLKKLATAFPNENYIYLADLARVPFGDKSKEELTNIVNEIASWLSKFNPKAIITACNTSAALIQDHGTIGLWDHNLTSIIDPVAKEIATSNDKEVTVWATKFTIESNAYKKAINKLNPNIKVQEISCPKLVPVIENLECSVEEKTKVISEYLDQVSPSSDALIYGCTHYPHIDEMIKKQRGIRTVDPADAIVKDMHGRGVVYNASTGKTPLISLYTTAQKEKLEKFSRLYLCGDYKVSLVTLDVLQTR